MSATSRYTSIPGSERHPVRGARLIHNSHPDQVIEVSVRLRRKSEAERPELASRLHRGEFQRMSKADFEAAHGADPADVEQIRKFAREYNLKVHETATDLARRTVVLSGTVRDLQRAFKVELKEYSHPRGNFRGRTGEISAPAEYADVIRGVFGLDNRPQAEPHFRSVPESAGAKAHRASTSHDPNEIARLYNFPSGDGTNQCIGIIELGGGFQLDDITNYFSSLNLNVPQVIAVSVDGGTNSPGDPNGDDGEVMLDIEVAGAVAPQAKIVVYFAPNTDRGFLDAITTAVHDSTNNPSVISISWGMAETGWTEQALINFNEAFQTAAAVGVTVCAASGDNGSSDGVNDGDNHVDYPASDPFVLGCGGTSLRTRHHKIREVVWNDLPNGGAGGGGVSDVFPLPTWQDGLAVPPPTTAEGGRGVPDVAGDADPNTGYNVLVDGQSMVIGGTSAVAPLYAGLVALINEERGEPIGYLNPLIYADAVRTSAFRDVTQGNNGSFSAAKGWDPCTGNGTLDGTKLQQALTGAPAAQAATAIARGGAKKPAA
jgi:kumamolisin